MAEDDEKKRAENEATFRRANEGIRSAEQALEKRGGAAAELAEETDPRS